MDNEQGEGPTMHDRPKRPLRVMAVARDPSVRRRYREMLASASDIENHLGSLGGAPELEAARRKGRPFALVFVGDPGWSPGDFDRHVRSLRVGDPGVHIILVGRSSDLPVLEIAGRVPPPDRLFFLDFPIQKGPFLQTVAVLGAKWRSETLLRGSRTLFRTFMKHLPGPAFIEDRLKRYLFVNDAMKRCLGAENREYLFDDVDLPTAGAVAAPEGADGPPETRSPIPMNGNHTLHRFPISRKGEPYLICAIAPPTDDGSAALPPAPEEDVVIPGPPGSGVGFGPDPPTLDIKEGLKRVGGSWKMYVDLAAYFCRDKKDFSGRFRERLDRSDFETARIMAHSLKGSAATIGASEVSELARSLEGITPEDEPEAVQEALVALETALSRLASEVASLAEQAPPDPPAAGAGGPPPAPEEIRRTLGELDASLADLDPLSSDLHVDRILSVFDPEHTDDEWMGLLNRLDALTAAYRFDEARKVVELLLKKIGEPADG